jgi:glucose-1-phosphate cytidylyltransferase
VKVVILAGGLGTRISEETAVRPKPMIEIGGKPLLWHIMKIYASHGLTDFIICLGYKGYVIKEYFSNYFLHNSDVTFDLGKNAMTIHNTNVDPWRVTLVDTGDNTMTGGRVKRIRQYLEPDERFCLTYGDGVSDVNIRALVDFSTEQGTLATVTAVQPPGRYGALELDGPRIRRFKEKPQGDGGWINGGFFVLHPRVIDYIEGDGTPWEAEPMEAIARDGQFSAYLHSGFWQPVDTLRDRLHLEHLWATGQAEWKVW